MAMEKDAKKLFNGYEKFTGKDVKVQETPVSPGNDFSKRKLEEPTDKDKYR